MGDGNGWARCSAGHVHWGRYGAAGLLAYHRAEPGGDQHILMQQRAWWTPGGRTWGLLGGACDSHEDAVAAALREAAEESTVDPAGFAVHGVRRDDHGGWWFDTVIASADRLLEAGPASAETKDVAWVPVDEVAERPLFPPFAATWPRLRDSLVRLVVVVDAANVVGARADGWWRDRAGATRRLRDELAGFAAAGVTGLPDDVAAPALDLWYPDVVLVVEGAARAVADAEGAPPGVRVVAAPGSGDDTIVAAVAEYAAAPDATTLVVTADRELRGRCRAAGAAVAGPRWLLSRL
jgi:8-oxo-dGTP diphosphatase